MARSVRTTASAARRTSTPTTKKFVEQVDEMMKHKEAELLEV
jgi:ribosome recycling factor